MKIEGFEHNEAAGVRLGKISGNHKELTALHTAIGKLLKGTEEETRRHTQGLTLGGQGLLVSMDPGVDTGTC